MQNTEWIVMIVGLFYLCAWFYGMFFTLDESRMSATEKFAFMFIVNPLSIMLLLVLWPAIFIVMIPEATQKLLGGYLRKRGKA